MRWPDNKQHWQTPDEYDNWRRIHAATDFPILGGCFPCPSTPITYWPDPGSLELGSLDTPRGRRLGTAFSPADWIVVHGKWGIERGAAFALGCHVDYRTVWALGTGITAYIKFSSRFSRIHCVRGTGGEYLSHGCKSGAPKKCLASTTLPLTTFSQLIWLNSSWKQVPTYLLPTPNCKRVNFYKDDASLPYGYYDVATSLLACWILLRSSHKPGQFE